MFMSAARPFFYLVIQLNITSNIKDLGVNAVFI